MSEARSLKLAEEIETMTENLPQIQSKSEEFGFDFQRGEPIPNHDKFDWKLVSPPEPAPSTDCGASSQAPPSIASNHQELLS